MHCKGASAWVCMGAQQCSFLTLGVYIIHGWCSACSCLLGPLLIAQASLASRAGCPPACLPSSLPAGVNLVPLHQARAGLPAGDGSGASGRRAGARQAGSARRLPHARGRSRGACNPAVVLPLLKPYSVCRVPTLRGRLACCAPEGRHLPTCWTCQDLPCCPPGCRHAHERHWRPAPSWEARQTCLTAHCACLTIIRRAPATKVDRRPSTLLSPAIRMPLARATHRSWSSRSSRG